MPKAVFSLQDGKEFVRIARKSIEYFMHTGRYLAEDAPNKDYNRPGPAFVTLKTFPTGDLRGCIGYMEAVKPLWRAIIECAVSAAFNDPRFPPLSAVELDKVLVEVSVLTPAKEMKVKAGSYAKEIEVGKDGLVAELGNARGVLLPQVPVEWGWSAEEFLGQVCEKAGLPKDAWKENGFKLYKFGSIIFSEKLPKGEIVKE